MIEDNEVIGTFADFIAEALDSGDPAKQREALILSEQLAWKKKSLQEHRDFLRDCSILLMEPNLELLSVLNLAWKIRFWQSFQEPLKSLLGDCDLDWWLEGTQRSLLIRCPDSTTVATLYRSLPLISSQIYEFTGCVQQVYLTASSR